MHDALLLLARNGAVLPALLRVLDAFLRAKLGAEVWDAPTRPPQALLPCVVLYGTGKSCIKYLPMGTAMYRCLPALHALPPFRAAHLIVQGALAMRFIDCMQHALCAPGTAGPEHDVAPHRPAAGAAPG